MDITSIINMDLMTFFSRNNLPQGKNAANGILRNGSNAVLLKYLSKF